MCILGPSEEVERSINWVVSPQVSGAPPVPISKRKKILLHFLAADLGMSVLKSSCYGKVTLLACLGEESTHPKVLTFEDR